MTDVTPLAGPGRVYAKSALGRIPGSVPMPGREGHIYVVEYSTGTVKVGKAVNPNRRVQHHDSVAAPMEQCVTRAWVSPVHVEYSANERLLIDFGQSLPCRRVRFTFTDLDRDAAHAEDNARIEAYRRLIRSSPEAITVSREYFDCAEQWLSLTNGPTANGTPRVPPPVITRGDPDEVLDWADRLADALDTTVNDVLDMSWLDLVEGALETRVRTAALEWRIFAYRNGREDLLSPGGILDGAA